MLQSKSLLRRRSDSKTCPCLHRDGFGSRRKLVDAVNFGTGAAEWDQEDLECLKAAYDGEILYWDSELERLLDYLQDLGMRDDTFVIVTSDHGEEFLEHGRLKHGLHLYDQSIRVPLILQGPGAAVGVHEALVETRKLFDLCAALVSADEKEPIELVGFLRSSRDFAFAHTDHGKIDERPGRVELMAVRDAQWKLIEYPVTGRQELDRLGVDSAETRNVFDEKPAVATRYSRLLLGWLEVTSARSAAGRGVDPQILEKLKALGYIQ